MGSVGSSFFHTDTPALCEPLASWTDGGFLEARRGCWVLWLVFSCPLPTHLSSILDGLHFLAVHTICLSRLRKHTSDCHSRFVPESHLLPPDTNFHVQWTHHPGSGAAGLGKGEDSDTDLCLGLLPKSKLSGSLLESQSSRDSCWLKR